MFYQSQKEVMLVFTVSVKESVKCIRVQKT